MRNLKVNHGGLEETTHDPLEFQMPISVGQRTTKVEREGTPKFGRKAFVYGGRVGVPGRTDGGGEIGWHRKVEDELIEEPLVHYGESTACPSN